MLESDAAIRASEVAQMLGVAAVTVRRDLADMEVQGLVHRVRGGAVLNTPAVAAVTDLEPAAANDMEIGLLVPSLKGFWPNAIRGAKKEAERLGFSVVMRESSYNTPDERPILTQLTHRPGVAGLLVAPTLTIPTADDTLCWLRDCGLPYVLLEREHVFYPEGWPAESVISNHIRGAAIAVHYLQTLGHRRIAVATDRSSPKAQIIRKGWRRAIREADLDTTQPDLSFNGPPSSGSIRDIRMILDTCAAAKTTALLCHSDNVAILVAQEAQVRGIRVPDNLSILAYNDLVASLFTPALTAIQPPQALIGEEAVRLLTKRLADPTRPIHQVSITPTLAVRQSTAPPPSDT
jgi:DNA-binding LacI/PurR family transcriptional regulator